MMRSLKNTLVALVALTALAGCGQVPGSAGGQVGAHASWSSPTTLLAVRKDLQAGLVYQRMVLGSDEIKVGMSHSDLTVVANRYRDLSASAVARARGAADLQAYASKLQAVRQRDPGLRPAANRVIGSPDTAWTVGDYQNAFKAVADDIDSRLGQVKREKLD